MSSWAYWYIILAHCSSKKKKTHIGRLTNDDDGRWNATTFVGGIAHVFVLSDADVIHYTCVGTPSLYQLVVGTAHLHNSPADTLPGCVGQHKCVCGLSNGGCCKFGARCRRSCAVRCVFFVLQCARVDFCIAYTNIMNFGNECCILQSRMYFFFSPA